MIGAHNEFFVMKISWKYCPPIESIFHVENIWSYSYTLYHLWYLQIWDSSIVSDITSLLKLFKSIFLLCSIKYVTHQSSACRHSIFLSPKDIPLWLTGILDFNWHHYLTPVNFQYSTASCVSYPSSTNTLTCSVMYPRVPLCVPVKTLVGSGVDTYNGLVLACDTSSPCYTVENYCESVGGFWSTAE